MHRADGFTLIEVIIVVAVSGILLSVGIVALRPGRFAVNQAAQVVSGAVMKTRFEAIRTNRTAEFTVRTTGDGGYTICVDENDDGTCSTAEVIEDVDFGSGDLGKVSLSATTLTGNKVRFDRHGIPMSAVASDTITVTQRGATYSKLVELNSTGRAAIQ